ncbi:hypothetical protein JQC91_01975 [Jannaschia sp. Os4]|nr:hypothetical protein [Jannaschia sp. Os4]MBM2575061.1 hypothetical protein [Jannaschia sp. Os4]
MDRADIYASDALHPENRNVRPEIRTRRKLRRYNGGGAFTGRGADRRTR